MTAKLYGRNQWSRTTLWLAAMKVTPDARGDVIETLRGRKDFPANIPNQAYLYRFVRDRFKKAQREHLDAVPGLYQEYQDWWDNVFMQDDNNFKRQTVMEMK